MKTTKQALEEMKFTWGYKVPPVEIVPLDDKEKQELKDKWTEISNYYGKRGEK